MALSKELKIENVVVLANSFNPSIFSSHWLIKSGICDQGSILPNYMFAPNISQVSTNEFQLLVLPEQMQFSRGLNFEGKFAELVKSKVVSIVDLLKEVPYSKAGMNFHWFIKDDKSTIPELSKSLFFNKDSKLSQFFSTPDSQLGAYFSKDMDGVRLKLDIKPLIVQFNEEAKREHVIQFAFNFHKDLNRETAYDELVDFVKNYDDYFQEASKIVNIYA